MIFKSVGWGVSISGCNMVFVSTYQPVTDDRGAIVRVTELMRSVHRIRPRGFGTVLHDVVCTSIECFGALFGTLCKVILIDSNTFRNIKLQSWRIKNCSQADPGILNL